MRGAMPFHFLVLTVQLASCRYTFNTDANAANRSFVNLQVYNLNNFGILKVYLLHDCQEYVPHVLWRACIS
jgi:hypothetical protein